jgi:hypothetical protein
MSAQRERLLSFPKKRAAEWPITRGCAQASLCRVVLNVFNGLAKVFFVSEVSIKIVFNPKLATPAQYFVCLMRCVRLQGVHKGLQFVVLEPGEQVMEVVWHHHPVGKAISSSI